eukprot:8152264-Alexandrium_andersonii.AAC.1
MSGPANHTRNIHFAEAVCSASQHAGRVQCAQPPCRPSTLGSVACAQPNWTCGSRSFSLPPTGPS